MDINEETALADEMLRRFGNNAAIRASDKACVAAVTGDEDEAAKWRRVLVLIAARAPQKGLPRP